MPQVGYIINNDKQMLLIDYSGSPDVAAIKAIANKAEELIVENPKGSVLVIVDFKGVKMSPQAMNIIREMAAHNRPYGKFVALCNLGLIRSLFMSIMLASSGRGNHKVFMSREKGIVWLAGK